MVEQVTSVPVSSPLRVELEYARDLLRLISYLDWIKFAVAKVEDCWALLERIEKVVERGTLSAFKINCPVDSYC